MHAEGRRGCRQHSSRGGAFSRMHVRHCHRPEETPLAARTCVPAHTFDPFVAAPSMLLMPDQLACCLCFGPCRMASDIACLGCAQLCCGMQAAAAAAHSQGAAAASAAERRATTAAAEAEQLREDLAGARRSCAAAEAAATEARRDAAEARGAADKLSQVRPCLPAGCPCTERGKLPPPPPSPRRLH